MGQPRLCLFVLRACCVASLPATSGKVSFLLETQKKEDKTALAYHQGNAHATHSQVETRRALFVKATSSSHASSAASLTILF